jgi:ABC-type branched-subunit amino acid transport system permease subunit
MILYIVLGYCGMAYILGIIIAVWYFLGGIVLHRTKENLRFWPLFLCYIVVLAPIFVPWWIVTFINRNTKN